MFLVEYVPLISFLPALSKKKKNISNYVHRYACVTLAGQVLSTFSRFNSACKEGHMIWVINKHILPSTPSQTIFTPNSHVYHSPYKDKGMQLHKYSDKKIVQEV